MAKTIEIENIEKLHWPYHATKKDNFEYHLGKNKTKQK